MCCVYGAFDAEVDEWQLRPLPTLCGRFDPRRLFVVSFGQGASAANVADDALDEMSMDSLSGVRWGGDGVLQPPYKVFGIRPRDIEMVVDDESPAATKGRGDSGGGKTAIDTRLRPIDDGGAIGGDDGDDIEMMLPSERR